MRGQFKVLLTIIAVSIFLLVPSYSQAQALPAVRLTAPTVVQAEIGKEFVIPLTITMGAQEDTVGGVRPRIDSTSIRVEEVMVGQILPPNASINTSLKGVAQAAGIFRVTLDVDAAGFLFSTDVMVEVTDPDEAQRRARFSVASAAFVPVSPDLDKPFTLRITLKNTGNEPSGDVLAALDAGANFTIQSLTNRVDAASVNPGESAEVSFVLLAKEGRTSNSVALTLSYDTYTQTETLFLPLPDVPDPLSPPVLKVDSFTLTPAQEGQFVLSLTVVQ